MARRPHTHRVGTDPPKHPPWPPPGYRATTWGVVRGVGGSENRGPKTRWRGEKRGNEGTAPPEGRRRAWGRSGWGVGPGAPRPPRWPPAGYCATTWKCPAACPGSRKPKRGSALGPGSEPQSSKHEIGPFGTGIGKRSEDMGSVATLGPPPGGVEGPPPLQNDAHEVPMNWRAPGAEKNFSGRAPNLSRRSAVRSPACPKAFQRLQNACGAARAKIRHGRAQNRPNLAIFGHISGFRGSGRVKNFRSQNLPILQKTPRRGKVSAPGAAVGAVTPHPPGRNRPPRYTEQRFHCINVVEQLTMGDSA